MKNILYLKGMTPLHFAVDRGEVDIVQQLLDNGSEVNAQDSSGETPLMLAVTCEHLELVRLLLERGADKSIVNHDGCTVLDVEGLSEDIIQAILQVT